MFYHSQLNCCLIPILQLLAHCGPFPSLKASRFLSQHWLTPSGIPYLMLWFFLQCWWLSLLSLVIIFLVMRKKLAIKRTGELSAQLCWHFSHLSPWVKLSFFLYIVLMYPKTVCNFFTWPVSKVLEVMEVAIYLKIGLV